MEGDWQGGLCYGGLCNASLAGGALDDKGGGVAPVAGFPLTVALGGLQVMCGTADEALNQVVEQMTRKTHVDPWVAAAIQAGQ